MSIQKEDLLILAGELSAGTTEAHWRSAVSRAYYAAYHGCNDWHDALPAPGSNTGIPGGKHQQLINRLGHPAPEVKDGRATVSRLAGVRLGLLRTQRASADYQLQDLLDGASAQNACLAAKEILDRLEATRCAA